MTDKFKVNSIYFILAIGVVAFFTGHILTENEHAKMPVRLVSQGQVVASDDKVYTCQKDSFGKTYFTHLVLPYTGSNKNGPVKIDGYQAYVTTVEYVESDQSGRTKLHFKLVCDTK